MHNQLRASTSIYMATDGESKDDVVCFGIVVAKSDFLFACRGWF